MLKWIQDEYEAEVVALTVNLGQPGEDYEVVKGKALQLGALDCHVVDAREEFAREYVLPAIKANADYGDGYPLFTALGRPLIAKLAVEYARKTGCDTIAHGCTGKGNDQVRIEAHGRDARARAEGDRPGALVGDGPRRGDRLRAQARHPGQGRHRDARRTRSTTTSGAAPPRASGSRTSSHAPDDDVFQLVTRPELAPDEPQIVEVTFEAGVPVALDGERLELVELIERAAELGIKPRRRDRRPHRGPDRRPEGARHLRGPGGRDPAQGAQGARAPDRHDPPEPVQARARPQVGLPRVRRAVVGAAARGPRGLHRPRQPARDRARSA